uniref:DRBM domain-containing protein n=1 Tax=Fagus sylvatica TaxID=28930 RepID=A0A2N9FWG9_FAGSY
MPKTTLPDSLSSTSPLLNRFMDHSALYKNLLQELAQHEGFSIPLYNTTKSGALHIPTFFSTVEVQGEVFRGNEGKSKKQAELNAAKVAYAILKERGLSRSAEAASPSLAEDEALLTTSSTLTKTMESQQSLEDQYDLLPSPIIKYKETAKKDSTVHGVQEVGLTETLSSTAKLCTLDSSSSPVVLKIDQNTENGSTFSCPESVPSSTKQGLLSSPTLAHPDLSAVAISDSNMRKSVGTRSYLLCNRVRVYSSLPEIEFPKGIIVLPISDNKWVAVSLEFPNEESN